uniref:hypothetical protein n=1 Tax=Nocardia vaccinii TaxID=1822 RepID=UPI000AD4B0E4
MDLANRLAQPISRTLHLSQHLAKLRFTGMVDTRREGRRMIYRIRDGHLARLVREGLNHADHVITGNHPTNNTSSPPRVTDRRGI